MRKSLLATLFGFGARLAAVLFLTTCLACSPTPESPQSPARGPIVVISLSAMPASLVGALGGEPGWTPHLDQLATELWHGRGVAHSSSPVPSLASLLTGVDPWLHQVTSHRAGPLRSDVQTVAEALAGGDWAPRAFFPGGYHFKRHGLLEDFDSVEEIGGAEAHLRSMGARQLAWIHLPDPGFPYVDRRGQIRHLEDRPPVGERIERRWLMPYADPENEMPEPLLGAARELFRHQVAWADQRLGRLIDALKTNPAWPEASIFITALHGNELEAGGQVLFAQNLNRETLEVPLFIKVPAPLQESLPEPGLVSTTRLAATIFEIAGLPPVAAQAGSLLGQASARIPSALYDHDGVNRFSLLEPKGSGAGMQLVWQSRYAEAEPEMWAAQAIEAGLHSLSIGELPRRILGRLHQSFQRTAPLSGSGPDAVELRLLRWLPDGSVEPVQDALMASRMAAELRRNWLQFIGLERTPRAEKQYWNRVTSEQDRPG